MYPVAIIGNDICARTLILALRNSGFDDIQWATNGPAATLPAHTLPANLSRIVNALGRQQQLLELGRTPTREQVRLARSGYLISELPLGKFIHDRYGAPHVNIETPELECVLEVKAPSISGVEGLDEAAELDRQFPVVLRTGPEHPIAAPTHTLFVASIEHSENPHQVNREANITWLGEGQCAWQFSTQTQDHYQFAVPLNRPPEPADWHFSLHQAISQATPLMQFSAQGNPVREHWQEGSVAYLGASCMAGNPLLPGSFCLGMEDAWVLSRMLENYEQDVADGLREYERFRRARTRRVAANIANAGRWLFATGRISRLGTYLGQALSTRFLPEIAMQRIDWLYGYDCIRGFR